MIEPFGHFGRELDASAREKGLASANLVVVAFGALNAAFEPGKGWLWIALGLVVFVNSCWLFDRWRRLEKAAAKDRADVKQTK